ncbi:MAG: hypothetical protein WCO57_06590 [Verrucomicrobiota bacterium]
MSENNTNPSPFLTDPILAGAVALLQGRLSGGISPATYTPGTRPVDDRVLEEALCAAGRLAVMARSGPSDVEAYRLFEEGEQMNADKIATRFKDAGWRTLTAANSVRTLLKQIRSWHDGYITLPAKSVSARVRSADALLREIIGGLVARLNREHPQSDVVVAQLAGELAGELSKLHERWRTNELKSSAREIPGAPPMPHEGRSRVTNWQEMCFYAWCFEDRQQGNTTQYYFRPYEIFANALGGFPGKDQLIIGKGPHWQHLVSPRRECLAQDFQIFKNALGETRMIWDEEVDLNEFCRRFWVALNDDPATDVPAKDVSDEGVRPFRWKQALTLFL